MRKTQDVSETTPIQEEASPLPPPTPWSSKIVVQRDPLADPTLREDKFSEKPNGVPKKKIKTSPLPPLSEPSCLFDEYDQRQRHIRNIPLFEQKYDSIKQSEGHGDYPQQTEKGLRGRPRGGQKKPKEFDHSGPRRPAGKKKPIQKEQVQNKYKAKKRRRKVGRKPPTIRDCHITFAMNRLLSLATLEQKQDLFTIFGSREQKKLAKKDWNAIIRHHRLSMLRLKCLKQIQSIQLELIDQRSSFLKDQSNMIKLRLNSFQTDLSLQKSQNELTKSQQKELKLYLGDHEFQISLLYFGVYHEFTQDQYNFFIQEKFYQQWLSKLRSLLIEKAKQQVRCQQKQHKKPLL